MSDDVIELKLTLDDISYLSKCMFVYRNIKDLHCFFNFDKIECRYKDNKFDEMLDKFKKQCGDKMIWTI